MSDNTIIKHKSATRRHVQKNPSIDMALREKVLRENTRKTSVPASIAMNVQNQIIFENQETNIKNFPKNNPQVADRTQSMHDIPSQEKLQTIQNERIPSLPDICGFDQDSKHKRKQSKAIRDPSLPRHFDLSTWLLEKNV